MQNGNDDQATKILITGATGHLGSAVIRQLLTKTTANRIVAFARDAGKAAAISAKGVDVRLGDFDDTASLDTAMADIGRVLLIAGTDEENRVREHRNVVDAAQKAGVSCIAYTSRTLKNRSTMANILMEGHFQTEDYIRACGLNHVIFRNVLYMDAVPQFVGGNVFETGIHLPVGQGRVPFALRSEMGEAIANALLERTCDNRIYKLTGNEPYSFGDVATVLTEISGKKVDFVALDRPEFEARMKDRGLPETMVTRISGFLTDIKNGQEEEVSPDLQTLLGRKPTSLRDGLKFLFPLSEHVK